MEGVRFMLGAIFYGLGAVLGLLLVVALVAAIASAIGFMFSVAFAFFGISVPWKVCAVCWFLFLLVIRALRGGK